MSSVSEPCASSASICSGVAAVFALSISAITPETWGAAIEVPCSSSNVGVMTAPPPMACVL